MNINERYDDSLLAWQYELSGEGYEENNGDITHYLKLLGNKNIYVLELACGTGRITIPLLSAGVHVTGLDLSNEMLQIARQKAETLGVAVELVHADACEFSLKRKFDAIFMAYNSISLIPNGRIYDLVNQVRTHLVPGGMFIFDLVRTDFGRFDAENKWVADIPGFVDIPQHNTKIRRRLVARYLQQEETVEYVSEWEVQDQTGSSTHQNTVMRMSAWEPEKYAECFTKNGFSQPDIEEIPYKYNNRLVKNVYVQQRLLSE